LDSASVDLHQDQSRRTPKRLRRGAYGTTLRVAQKFTHQHPELIERQDALLTSINDRLGALCTRLSCQEAGRDFASLTDDWLRDLVDLAVLQTEERDELQGESDFEDLF
jgi:hypothetical protein